MRLAHFCKDADLIVGCLVHIATLPRWDHLMLVCYPVETHEIEPVYPDPSDEVLRIFHAPNHRAIKGTQHLIAAVEDLQAEGMAIELDLVERVTRTKVLERMARAHVLVEQLQFGYAQTALEGMALGKIVITGANPPEHDTKFMKTTALGECPVHWASPDTIKQVLRNIAENREKWRGWGKANRRFAELHHSYEATARAWQKVFDQLP
jgi:glycosyltransferase involved in cell wall biosynthesis